MPENTAEFPVRGQKTPDFWNIILKDYIDSGDALSIPAETVTRIVKLTQSEYDALSPKVSTTLYVVVPDSEVFVNGAMTFNTSEAVVIGSGPVLADSDDATYIQNLSYQTVDHNIGIEPLVTDAVLSSAALHIRMSVENQGAILYPNDVAEAFIFLQDGNATDRSGDYYVAQFTLGAWNSFKLGGLPTNGTITDMVLPMRLRPGKTLAEVQTVLESGNALLVVNLFECNESEDPSINRMYEASINYITT